MLEETPDQFLVTLGIKTNNINDTNNLDTILLGDDNMTLTHLHAPGFQPEAVKAMASCCAPPLRTECSHHCRLLRRAFRRCRPHRRRPLPRRVWPRVSNAAGVSGRGPPVAARRVVNQRSHAAGSPTPSLAAERMDRRQDSVPMHVAANGCTADPTVYANVGSFCHRPTSAHTPERRK